MTCTPRSASRPPSGSRLPGKSGIGEVLASSLGPTSGEVGKGSAANMHKLTRVSATAALTIAVSLAGMRSASAEIKIANIEGWDITTSGRVNGFFSYVQGDAY